MKDIVTYPNSPTYRPDIDSLTPVQAAVVKGLQLLDLSVPGSASALLTDLAEFSTLAYVGTFDYEEPLNPSSSPSATPAKKRVTYVALSKATMPVFVDLYLRFKEARDIYVDETIERLFLALSIPVKLKYESPPASKFGSDPPLWKTATTSFLKIVKEAAPRINKFDEALPPDRVEGIWRSALDVFRGGLLADCTPAENLPLEQQEEEEKFDLSLITSLEFDVIPHLGHHQVPDLLITQLGTTLQIASRLHDLDLKRQPAVLTPEPERTQFTESDEQKNSTQGKKANRSKGASRDLSDSSGSSLPTRSRAFTTVPLALIEPTTATGTLLPREQFSYWCFDLLFLICSKSSQGEDNARRRIAALVLPSLLDRCHVVLAGYIADAKLRGNIPFPRIQEEELLYILKRLVALDLWPGSLWAAYSNDPSRYSIDLPDPRPSLKGAHLIKDAIQRSSSAHLFHLYSLLCEISSTPSRSPSMWIQEKKMQQPTEIFARELAQAALQKIGKEMGIDG
ncbi:hypothetical protein FRC02_002577 [Tulasnella sp. 418]|nr:hypothetical protein FRC02_002577 [Tulasnella sp. 418]